MGKKWELIRVYPEMGRTRWEIRHLVCGKSLLVFLWAWAGHGKKRCPHCQEWIFYDVPSEREETR